MMIKRILAFTACLVMMLCIMAPVATASELEPLAPNCVLCDSGACVYHTIPSDDEEDTVDPPAACETCGNTPCSCDVAMMPLYGGETSDSCLTITASGNVDKNQALLFKISGEEYESVVALHKDENGISSLCIEGLSLGNTYTVEPLGNWSWRYTVAPATQSVTIQADSTQNVLNFTVSQTNYNWLSSESYRVF